VIGTFALETSFGILPKCPLGPMPSVILMADRFVTGLRRPCRCRVVVGVIVFCAGLCWNNARRIHAKTYTTPDGGKVYQIQGPSFLWVSLGVRELFKSRATERVIRRFRKTAAWGINLPSRRFETIARKIRRRGASVSIAPPWSRDCHRLLKKAGHLMID